MRSLTLYRFLSGDPTSHDSFRSERLLSRFGHSMLYDPQLSTVYIFSGQRSDSYLSDLWSIKLASPIGDEEGATDLGKEGELWRAGAVLPAAVSGAGADNGSQAVDSDTPTATSRQPTILQIKQLSSDYSAHGPPAAFTQRASIDPVSGQWTLMSGLIKDRKTLKETPVGEMWTRSREGKWDKVEARGETPCGRYAAQVSWWPGVEKVHGVHWKLRVSMQVVYDPLRQEHYLFGGNPSQTGDEARLGDFWRLKIVRWVTEGSVLEIESDPLLSASPSPDEALRRAKFLVRKQRRVSRGLVRTGGLGG